MGCLNHSSILIDIAIEVSHHLHDKLVVDVRASGWCCSGQMFAINDRGMCCILTGYRFCLWKLSKGFKTVWRWAPHEVSEAAAQGFEDEGMRPVKQTYSETNIHTYVHTYIHTYIHTYRFDRQTYIHTYIHVCIHCIALAMYCDMHRRLMLKQSRLMIFQPKTSQLKNIWASQPVIERASQPIIEKIVSHPKVFSFPS